MSRPAVPGTGAQAPPGADDREARLAEGGVAGRPGRESAGGSRAPAVARERLHAVLARRCRGRVLVLEGGEGSLAAALGARGLEAKERRVPLSASVDLGDECRTVVIHEVPDLLRRREAERLLERAWSAVARGGRLVAVVPNAECGNGDGLDRRALDRLLGALGRPKLITEQPYRWVAMYVEKRPPKREGAGYRARLERYGVTAELCRGRVVELGCGEGVLAAAIAGHGCEVVGVDLSERKIRAARVAHPHIHFLRSDIRELDLPAASFDTAVLAEVLEHVTEGPGEEILLAAWRLVKPGGRLVVSVPNEDCVPHRNHLRQFDRERLAETLRPFGHPDAVADQPFKWLLMHVEKTP